MSEKPLIRLRLLADEWVVPAVCFGLAVILVLAITLSLFSLIGYFQLHTVVDQTNKLLHTVSTASHHRNIQLNEVLANLRVLLARKS